jgi:hypothetical protein
VLWAALSVMIFSGWFVITRFSVTRELRMWDILALWFGVGALVLAPTIPRREARLPTAAWLKGLLFCLLWGLPFVLLVALGLAVLVGAALLWVIYTIVFRRSSLSPVQAAALICTWSAILFLPVYALLGLSRLPRASLPDLAGPSIRAFS